MTDVTFDATPRGPYRRFVAPDGADWLAWLLAEDAVDQLSESSLGREWLIFLGPNGDTRRLAPVPPGWRRMPDEALHALAKSASPLHGEIA